jgi:hypothetical protein
MLRFEIWTYIHWTLRREVPRILQICSKSVLPRAVHCLRCLSNIFVVHMNYTWYSKCIQAGWWRCQSMSPCRVKNFYFSIPSRPPSLLSNGYWGQGSPSMKLTTHLQLVPKSRKCGSLHLFPVHFHAIQAVLSQLSTGTTIPYTCILQSTFQNAVLSVLVYG